MLAVGVLGFPLIGALQANKEISEVSKVDAPGLVANGDLVEGATEAKKIYQIIPYSVLSTEVVEEKLASASPETKDAVDAARKGSAPKALMSMTIFPLMMLIAYIGIFMYFKSRGGYKPIELDSGGGSSSDD